MDKIGIDLGGTKTEGILLDEELQVIERKRVSTNQSNGYGSILDTIKDLVNELKQKSEDDTSIGVCTPGALSKKSGLIKNSNTQCLIGKDLKSDLEKILNQEISIENDNGLQVASYKVPYGSKLFFENDQKKTKFRVVGFENQNLRSVDGAQTTF